MHLALTPVLQLMTTETTVTEDNYIIVFCFSMRLSTAFADEFELDGGSIHVPGGGGSKGKGLSDRNS